MEKAIPLAITLKESVCSQLSQWAKAEGLVLSPKEPLAHEVLASVASHFIQRTLAESPCSLGDNLGKVQAEKSASLSLVHDLVTLRQKVESLSQRVAQLEEATLHTFQQATLSSSSAAKSLRDLRDKSPRRRKSAPDSSSGGTVADRPEEWLSTADAFRLLGGDPEDSNSTISSLDGTRSVKFNTFRLWQSSESYAAFGLELNRRRRLSKKPCLRFLSVEVSSSDPVRVNGESA